MAKYALLNQDIDTSFLTIEMTWAGMRSSLLKKQVGTMVPNSFCELIKGDTLNYFQNEKQALVFSHACAHKVVGDKKLLASIKKRSLDLSARALNLATKNFPLPTLSDSNLIKLINDIRKIQIDFAAWGMLVAFADIYGEISDQVVKIFSSRDELKLPLNFYLEKLANPTSLSLSAAAYQDIRTFSDDKKLLKKYFWLDQGYIGRGLTSKQLRLIRRQQSISSVKPNFNKSILLKELNLSISEQRLLTVASSLVEIKSLRADSRQALHVVLNNIIDLLAKRWKVAPKYLETLSSSELCSLIKKPEDILKNLPERWARSLIVPLNDNLYKFISNQKKIDIFLSNRIKSFFNSCSEISELKGQIAQPGKVKGRVKLVFGSQHNSKVKRGDILVSISTSPQLLPAMKLAAAFITEMGGITSHAAIVAREFHKPCIVGTKIATQVLHDGDLVEVDADKGVVKIIK